MSRRTSGILFSRSQAIEFAAQCRAEGRRLVVTNGCFDLLHAGHVAYLAAARALGDALLVGLNADATVRSLKGPGRPLTGQADRAAVLLALRAVDAVVVFAEPTAGPLLDELRAPIYAKGGDYSAGTSGTGIPLPEEPVVRGYGGAIHLLPYRDGCSTSALIERIRRFGG
ncbi:MAG TPA: adenylyltransferase/cytidyltransferase family protein [Chloroflexota bacterium]|nr:adenylyltransferase/cytidyltransferase family protein [Chloroflexota bacterium]